MSREQEKKKFNKKLSKLIYAIRTDARLTQKQLADMLGISSSTISAWEMARIMPTFYNIARLAKALDLSEEALAKECLEA